MKYFEEYFQWRRTKDYVIELDDGSLSAIIKYQGWDFSLMSLSEMESCKIQMQNMIHGLDKDITIEFHMIREFKSKISDAYKSYPLKRAKEFCGWFRQKVANHIAKSELHNSCYLVVTKKAKKEIKNPTKRFKQQQKMMESFATTVDYIVRHVLQGELASLSTLIDIINFCYYQNRSSDVLDGCLAVNLMCQGKPQLKTDCLKLPDGRYCTTLMLQYYPDCHMGWITDIAKLFGEMHFVFKIQNTDSSELLKSKKAEDLSLALSSREGAEEAAVMAGEHQELRGHIAVNNLKLFKNCWSVTLFDHDQDSLKERTIQLTDLLHQQSALVRNYSELQMSGWYYNLPCHGHLNQRWRSDETWQVVGMIPCQQYYCGREEVPYMLRLGEGLQAVALGYTTGEVAHHFTIAVTGAGKSLDACARILECYGVGVDIYLLEIGKSAWWAIEALEGNYHAIDPEHTAINPLPPLSALDENNVIPQDIVSVTVDTLAFLLKPTINNNCSLDSYERTAVQMALQNCYKPESKKMPNLIDLKNNLKTINVETIPQIADVSKRMSNYLGAFLLSVEGKKFMKNEELTILPGACGIDLSLVRTKAPSLLKLYLVFVALKYGQLAASHKKPAEIILDETHEFVRIAPEVMRPLIEGLARMGRKEASSINLITQELGEIDAIGHAVINQMLRKTLLYRTGSHDGIAQRIRMPEQIVEVWKNWGNPYHMDWRPGLEFDGKHWVELMLTFPQEALALTRTDPKSTQLKEKISLVTQNPIKRVELFLNEA